MSERTEANTRLIRRASPSGSRRRIRRVLLAVISIGMALRRQKQQPPSTVFFDASRADSVSRCAVPQPSLLSSFYREKAP
jgi:hypothetical protein